ncbi:MAG TPA: hypothetical protein VMX17_05790 [Candidatus Glassbacteria bacterium]|nr:hypothetical protein [Candidatus Glassbacteria bacterium]
MTTTRETISNWFDAGLEYANGGWLIIVTDTFEWEEYPVFVENNVTVFWEKYDHYNGKNMQKVMEVYDLKADKETQINSNRNWNMPERITA